VENLFKSKSKNHGTLWPSKQAPLDQKVSYKGSPKRPKINTKQEETKEQQPTSKQGGE